MDELAIILYCSVAFSLVLVVGAMYWVQRTWRLRKEERERRQASMVEQGKLISAQGELLKWKEKLIEGYRELND